MLSFSFWEGVGLGPRAVGLPMVLDVGDIYLKKNVEKCKIEAC